MDIVPGSGTAISSVTVTGTSDVNIKQVGGFPITQGQKTMANSFPVVVASDQSAIPVTGTFWQATQPISGTVTANAGTNLNTSALALESGGNLATLAGIVSSSKAAVKAADGDLVTLGNKTDAKSTATDTTSVSVVSVLKEISAMAQAPASTPVTGTFWQATQPVSGTVTANAGTGTFNIQSNASVNVNLVGGNPVVTAANGVQVVDIGDGTNNASILKSDGTSASQNGLMIAATGQTITYSTGSSGAVASGLSEGYATVAVDIKTGLTGGSTQFQVSNDNVNWRPIRLIATDASDFANSPGNTSTMYTGSLQGAKYFRLNLTGSGGTAAGTVHFSTLPPNSPISSYVANSNDGVAVNTNTTTIPVVNNNMIYNGTTYDRMPGDKTNGAYANIKAGAIISTTGGTLAASVLNLGAEAVNAEPAATTNTKQVQLIADLVGKLIVLPYANPENFVSGRASATDTTSTSLLSAPASGLRNYITQITLWNSSAVNTYVKIQDGSGGTELYDIPAPAGGGATLSFPTPLRQPTTATAIYFAENAAANAIVISASGYKGQ